MENDALQQILPLFLDHSEVAVAIKDINGRYLFANREFGHYAEAAPKDVIGHFGHECLAPERAQRLHVAEQSVIREQKGVCCEESFTRAGALVCYLSMHFPILDENDRMIALGAVVMDITARRAVACEVVTALKNSEQLNAQLRKAVETLEKLARTDRLTGAWNRSQFEEVVEGEIHRSDRYGHPISMMLLDIDNFKAINDTRGHLVGDRVLRELADCVREVMRKSDSLTRWGGEEFIVLTPNTGLPYAHILAERTRENVASHVFEGLGNVTVSIGVAEYAQPESRDDWLNRADRAMYRAKQDGRNRVEPDAKRALGNLITEHIEGSFVQLVWKDAFLSGNRVIDEEHRGLFRLSNELINAVLSGRPEDEVAGIVTRLLDAIAQHFRNEEAILAELKFAGLQEHAAEHARLIAKGLELAKEFGAGTLPVGRLMQYLTYDVAALHMLGADREFFPLIN